jgi:hypothetical protein
MAARDSELVSARRTRLNAWIQERYAGVQADFIAAVFAKTGVRLNQGELSSLLKADGKSFGEKKAENLESLIDDMPVGYLRNPTTPIHVDLNQLPSPAAPQQSSQAVALDPDMVAETHQALRLYYRRRGKEYDIERQPDEFIWAYGLRLSLGDTPSSADLIDFGAKLAERIRKRAEAGRGDQQDERGKATGGNRRGA